MARILFANTTNSPRSPTPLGFINKPRKSAPTCTVSLASVSTTGSGLSITLSSPPSPTPLSPPPRTPNTVAFPSSIASDTSSCLSLLKASSSEPPAQERRKRSTTRLLAPISLVPSSGDSTGSEPARKRPRLGKVKGSASSSPSGGAGVVAAGKRTPALTSSDLRFLASVQRSVACGVNERRKERSSLLPTGSGEVVGESSSVFEAQDTLLASRLKTLLLSRGIKPHDLIDLQEDEDKMDVDVYPSTSALDTTDMDIDADSPVPPRSSPPPPASRMLPSSSPALPPSPKLIAAIIMRHRSRKPSSRAAGSERNGLGQEKAKRLSPLASASIIFGAETEEEDGSRPSDD